MTARTRIHLMPVVMTAAAALLALKTVGLVSHAGDLFASPAAAASPKPAAATKPAEPAPAPKPPPPPDPIAEMSPSERALLEALQARRKAIEQQATDLEAREALLSAAEKRIDERLVELKRLEQQVAAADARRAEEEKARLKELVTMYEGMKVKQAARIFDQLDPSVLLEVASRMNPRQMAEVLGQMTPEAAQKLTVALARRDLGGGPAAVMAQPMAAGDLPKIEGRPAR